MLAQQLESDGYLELIPQGGQRTEIRLPIYDRDDTF